MSAILLLLFSKASTVSSEDAPAPSGEPALLLETGDYLLLETGDNILLEN